MRNKSIEWNGNNFVSVSELCKDKVYMEETCTGGDQLVLITDSGKCIVNIGETIVQTLDVFSISANSVKKINKNESIEVFIGDKDRLKIRGWRFCQGNQGVIVNVSPAQFQMLKQLVVDPKVVAYYESTLSNA